MNRQIKAPSREREGAGVRVPALTKKTSERSITHSGTSAKLLSTFDGHRFLCFFRQEAVYAGNPNGLCFLREEALVALTPEELDALSHSFLPYCFPKLQAALAVEELEAVV